MSDSDFDDIRQRCAELRTLYAARDQMLTEMRAMFRLEWTDRPKGDWIKPTLSPDAHNSLLGAVRLMTSTDPQFTVPYDESAADSRASADKVEQAARVMWAGSGRALRRPVHYDLVFSALFGAEICGAVSRTADLVDLAQGRPGQVARMQHLARHAPYLFHIWDPATCYTDQDIYGVAGMLRRSTTTWGEVLATWGDQAERAAGQKTTSLGARARRPSDEVVVNDWYDWDRRAVWLDESDEPIEFDAHELAFLPVVSQVVDGTMLWREPEYQRTPFLYAIWKSEIWKRQNLALTTIYSLIHALGSNPLLQQEVEDEGDVTRLDRSYPGGVIPVPVGRPLKPLMEKIVDPEQYRGLEIAQQLAQESTISKMALGAPPGHVMAFSAISLLVQSGRLPLVATRQLGGQAIADLVSIGLEWYRDNPDGGMYGAGRRVDLNPNDIPEDIALNVTLDVSLPTDKLQLANAAGAVVRDGLAPKSWARENILGVGQSGKMQGEIWTERRVDFELERILSRLTAQDQLAIQQAAQMGAASDQARGQSLMQNVGARFGSGAPAPSLQSAPSPDEGAYPPGGEIGPGAPLAGPLPGPAEEFMA